jgi:hypothetical protein
MESGCDLVIRGVHEPLEGFGRGITLVLFEMGNLFQDAGGVEFLIFVLLIVINFKTLLSQLDSVDLLLDVLKVVRVGPDIVVIHLRLPVVLSVVFEV